jgi:hypothetical protein
LDRKIQTTAESSDALGYFIAAAGTVTLGVIGAVLVNMVLPVGGMVCMFTFPVAMVISVMVAHGISEWMYRNRFEQRDYDEGMLQTQEDWQAFVDALAAAVDPRLLPSPLATRDHGLPELPPGDPR